MGNRILYLVRHGQLDRVAFERDQFTAGLTPTGREQAHFTAKRLGALDVRVIHTGTIGRARETANILSSEFPQIPVLPSRLLWELPNLGPADNEEWRRIFAEGTQRGERAFRKYVRPTRERERVEILVSHGNLIPYFVCRVLGISIESWSALATSHCAITQLSIEAAGRIRILSYNEASHLPAHLRT